MGEYLNPNLGTYLRIKLGGIEFQVKEILDQRNLDLKSAVEKYFDSNLVMQDLQRSVDRMIEENTERIIIQELTKRVADEFKKNKIIKKTVEDYIVKNKLALVEAFIDSLKILK